MTVTIDEAVTEFFALAETLNAGSIAAPAAVLDGLMAFYENREVANATRPNDDMMLLQWGSMSFLSAQGPVDFRDEAKRYGVEFESEQTRYLDITRQIVPRIHPRRRVRRRSAAPGGNARLWLDP